MYTNMYTFNNIKAVISYLMLRITGDLQRQLPYGQQS